MASRAGTVIAVTLGDPAGIGPEVALQAAFAHLSAGGRKPQALGVARLVLIGDCGVAEAARVRLKLTLEIQPVDFSDTQVALPSGTRRGRLVVPLVQAAPGLRPADRVPGSPSRGGARAAYAAVERAVGLAQAGAVQAICTAPISKEWFDRAGVASTGHTEILAELTGSKRVRLMMALGGLRVVLATTHLALRDVPGALTCDGIAETISITAAHLRRWWGITRPRIAVAALNPHAGDGGIYGDEEQRILAPAIARARRARIDALGPVPADTLFSALGPEADAVVAMYHDQGLIPIKQADVHHAVNVTLGLPFVRTSPDHGTAFDLAGRGRADPRSMKAALLLAVELVERSGVGRGAPAPSRRASTPRRKRRPRLGDSQS